MGYTEAYTIVEGAYDEERNFNENGVDETDGKTYDEWLSEVATDAEKGCVTIEVYTLYHGHDIDDMPDGGCECVQYLTDHHPDVVYGPSEEQ